MKHVRFKAQNREEYKKVDQATRKEMTKVQENWLQQKCDKIEKETIEGNSKEAFKTVKDLTIVNQSTIVLDGWSEYCKVLYKHPIKVDETLIVTEKSDPIFQEELEILFV